MDAFLFLLMFFGLLAAGMPIFLVLGACAAALYLVSGQPLIGVAQVVIDHLNSSTLMSLPLFVMAAAFMRQGGVAKALVDVSAAWLGGIRGSLGLVTVVACTMFAAISGSSVATALAMGTILLPAMLEKGYPRGFALGVVGASGTIGIVIPPSLALILYGIVTEQSVPRLFLAGILPGLLQAGAFFVWVWYYARRKNLPMEPTLPLAERLRAINPAVEIVTRQTRLTPSNITCHFESAECVCEAFDLPEAKQMFLEAFLASGKFLVMGSGMAGISNQTAIAIRKLKENLHLVGDGVTSVSPENPPCAPRVAACAALMASVLLEYVCREEKG